MYDHILEALFRMNNRTTVEEQIHYLEGLKPVARSLWNAYMLSDRSHVSVSYKDPAIQAVYMLRYFPQYSEIICDVLSTVKRKTTLPFDQEFLSGSFFGSGPAPELYGFLQFLKENFSAAQMIVAYLFDAAADDWEPARGITLHQLLPRIWDKQLFQVCQEPFDISQSGALAGIVRTGGQNFISDSSLIVFQNCLNETSPSNHRIIRDNFVMLIRMMTQGKLLVVIDRYGYPHVLKLLSNICEAATIESIAEVLIELNEMRQFDCNAVLDRMPEIIITHFLVRKRQFSDILPEEDGLVCARYIKYHCLVLRRL